MLILCVTVWHCVCWGVNLIIIPQAKPLPPRIVSLVHDLRSQKPPSLLKKKLCSLLAVALYSVLFSRLRNSLLPVHYLSLLVIFSDSLSLSLVCVCACACVCVCVCDFNEFLSNVCVYCHQRQIKFLLRLVFDVNPNLQVRKVKHT